MKFVRVDAKIFISIFVSFCFLLFVGAHFGCSAVEYDYLEPIKINNESLNGNAIWGLNESWDEKFDNHVPSGTEDWDFYKIPEHGIDGYAAFYCQDDSRNGGKGGLPANGELLVKENYFEDGVIPFQLAGANGNPYDGGDCIRLYNGNFEKTVTLDSLGYYDAIYILGLAGGVGTDTSCDISVRFKFSDNSDYNCKISFLGYFTKKSILRGDSDWYVGGLISQTRNSESGQGIAAYVDDYYVRRLSTGFYRPSSSSEEAPKLQVYRLNMEKMGISSKSVKSITFKYEGDDSELFANIYAITGRVSHFSVVGLGVGDITSSSFKLSWQSSLSTPDGYTDNGYRIEISENEKFEGSDSSRLASSSPVTVRKLKEGTKYYFRVIRLMTGNGGTLQCRSTYGSVTTKSIVKISCLKPPDLVYNGEYQNLLVGVVLTNSRDEKFSDSEDSKLRENIYLRAANAAESYKTNWETVSNFEDLTAKNADEYFIYYFIDTDVLTNYDDIAAAGSNISEADS